MNTITAKLYLLFLVLVCGSFVTSICGEENNITASGSGEFLFFRQEGAFSPFKFVELSIKEDGYVVTTFDRGNTDKGEIRFYLNEYELEMIKTLVRTVDFFEQTDKGNKSAIDLGQSTLRVSLEEKKRELIFGARQELEPLTSCLRKIIHQGVVLSDLKNKGDVYSALGSVSNYLASAKVLQPEVLQEPLEKFVENSNDRQKLLWGIETLSWIMTPEEWMGFLSKELSDPKETRKALLLEALSSHPFTGNIPPIHRDMLCPLFLANLRSEYHDWSKFSKEKQQAYSQIIKFLGERRYTVAMPILLELYMEEIAGNVKPISWLDHALPQMGEKVIKPLETLLDNQNPIVRGSATRLLGDILAMNPDFPIYKPISEKEQESILKTLRTTVRPKIQKLAENDSSSLVRDLAQSSLKQIDEGWRNK
ncbi:MAG: hypothetical protein JW715_04555 [Sedimentisphaerales bacterium]|nr:hypothetical protein [Sedimentisphaerales bacterium]